MSDELAVLAVNAAFYDAFNRRDMNAIEHLWADSGLTCIHPGWEALRGREEVLESFRAILEGRGAPRIRCINASAQVFGDAAIVLCGEGMGGHADPDEGAVLVATNVFARVGGRWRMVHHHAGPVSMRRARRSSAPPSPRSSSPPKKSDLN